MIHKMKLQPSYYDFILKGTKRIEIRLNDEKRSKIKIGDIIEFQKEPDLQECLKVRVVGLTLYKNFKSMFQDYDISILADKSMTKEKLLKDLEQFYTKEMQKKYGVIAIQIKLL